MPRDKTVSHERIVQAAMKEFLDKGFERASMKAVADAVGMTSAALYRHFASKQDMFAALVQPAVDALSEWVTRHVQCSYEAIGRDDTEETIWRFEAGNNDVRLVLDVMYQQPEAFRLLIFCSAGTPYEHHLHDWTELCTDEMMRYLQACKDKGLKTRQVQRDEMHMLVSASIAAMLQPIEHGYLKPDAERYLRTISEFFTPGWRMITGL